MMYEAIDIEKKTDRLLWLILQDNKDDKRIKIQIRVVHNKGSNKIQYRNRIRKKIMFQSSKQQKKKKRLPDN